MTTILAVGYETSSLAWLKSSLEAEGFGVIAAGDGSTGLTSLARVAGTDTSRPYAPTSG